DPQRRDVGPEGSGSAAISSMWYRPGPRPSTRCRRPSTSGAATTGSPWGSFTRNMEGFSRLGFGLGPNGPVGPVVTIGDPAQALGRCGCGVPGGCTALIGQIGLEAACF